VTVSSIKVKVVRKAIVKLKVLPKFPANVEVGNFLTVARSGSTYTFGVDYSLLGPGPILDPTTAMVVVLDETASIYRLVSLSSLIASNSQIVQTLTAAGPASVNANTGIVLVNQTVGAAMTLTLPLASAKTCPVLISDFKGDAGTNNITINLSGSDKFPGGLTSWTIGADTGSVFLRPISGVGYAL
jgi:hypothetical protein